MRLTRSDVIEKLLYQSVCFNRLNSKNEWKTYLRFTETDPSTLLTLRAKNWGT